METCPEPGCGKIVKNQMLLRSHTRTHHKPQVESSDTNSARLRSDSNTETLEEKVARLRKERKPIGVPEQKWSCPVNDGYQYRVFNDEWMTRPDNIQRALAAGYEFVNSGKEKQKTQVVGTNENGTSIKGYLMRIPKEIFDEDQAAKQKIVDRVDEQIRAGSLQKGADDRRYIPNMGIKITSDHRPPE